MVAQRLKRLPAMRGILLNPIYAKFTIYTWNQYKNDW